MIQRWGRVAVACAILACAACGIGSRAESHRGSNAGSGESGSGSSSGPSGSSGSSSSSGGSDDGGTTTCGCNGAAGCAVWTNVTITWYGFNDNSCTVESQHDCNNIAFPRLGPMKHTGATEGAGTYDDPITAAASDQGNETSGGVALSPGTIIYNPEVRKYFIMEDSCLECGDEWKCHLSAADTDDPSPPAGCVPGTNLHIDFWMGPSSMQDATLLDACESNSTIGDAYAGAGVVVVNPPPNLPVVTTPLYSGSGQTGGCWTSTQVSDDPCP